MTSLALSLLLAASPDGGSARMQMLLLPGATVESESVISEETAALEGIGFAIGQGLLSKSEAPKLRDALKAAYGELRKEYGATPTPVYRSIMGRQTPEGFDVLVFEPAAPVPSRAAIYLHGYGGNFTLQCWMFARAVADQGFTTVCPSMNVTGRWWEPKGEKILNATLDWLGKQKKTELILGGLSNGGAGATSLARRHEAKFGALILISGVMSNGPEHIPTLVLHGDSDATASYENAKRYAAAKNRTLITWPGGSHYSFLYERDAAARRISGWLGSALTSKKPDGGG